jgi:hypothetical protein
MDNVQNFDSYINILSSCFRIIVFPSYLQFWTIDIVQKYS